MNKKRRLLMFYDWFYPGFRAGGPVQSLTNLAGALSLEFEIFVVTGTHDLNLATPYSEVILNCWNQVTLPGLESSIKVFYSEKETLNRVFFTGLFNEVNADIIYLNGIFSYPFFLLPLLTLRKMKSEIKVVICPRGMLKKGALEGKSFKKKIYLVSVRLSGLLDTVTWHATTSEEAREIAHHFPVNEGIKVAPNIPKPPVGNSASTRKKKGELKLVYLSLINQHKNLFLLLQTVNEVKDAEISLDIYGPVVDEAYWTRCEAQIKQMQGIVQYKGAIQPFEVQEVLSKYHAAILLTKGENFGHALYESLGVGRPVMTSHYTPWQNLRELKGGANLDITDNDDCVRKVCEFINMDQEQYELYCKGAHSIAKNYYSKLQTKEEYTQLFQ